MSTGSAAEDLLRRAAPQVLAALVRRYGDFDAAEDAAQEAFLAAATVWPERGTPADPTAWLVTVASRRLVDRWRSDQARHAREVTVVTRTPADALFAPPADSTPSQEPDDTLTLFVLCCHPALPPPSAIALTLRAVGGLTTAQIARSFLVPEPTMAQRISRAKRTLREVGARFEAPARDEQPERWSRVLRVLYLMFNEGYTATDAPRSAELSREAIRLTRMARKLPADAGETTGLLALMLLTDARRAARTAADGSLIPLAEQDRGRWDSDAIAEGLRLVEQTLAENRTGPYQVQAAIAALHAQAARAEETDWPQIRVLYGILEALAPSPVVTVNHAVAAAMVEGAAAGLRMLEPLAVDPTMSRSHRLYAVRGHLEQMAGRDAAAIRDYRRAAQLTTSIPEQRYLNAKAEALTTGAKRPPGPAQPIRSTAATSGS